MRAFELWKQNTIVSALQAMFVGWLWLIDPQLMTPLVKSASISGVALLFGLIVIFVVIGFSVESAYWGRNDLQPNLTAWANCAPVWFYLAGTSVENLVIVIPGLGFIIVAGLLFAEDFRYYALWEPLTPRWLLALVKTPWGIGTVFGGLALLARYVLQKRRAQPV